VSWRQAIDTLHSKTQNHNCLGLRTARSDLIWRFYKKQVLEILMLRMLQEERMNKIEFAVHNTLSNETIMNNQTSCMDQIERILRSGDLKNNPLGMTVRRNFRFFCNVQYRMRLDM